METAAVRPMQAPAGIHTHTHTHTMLGEVIGPTSLPLQWQSQSSSPQPKQPSQQYILYLHHHVSQPAMLPHSLATKYTSQISLPPFELIRQPPADGSGQRAAGRGQRAAGDGPPLPPLINTGQELDYSRANLLACPDQLLSACCVAEIVVACVEDNSYDSPLPPSPLFYSLSE